MAVFDLAADRAQRIFSSGNTVTILGAHALSVTVTGNFTIGSQLDVSGREVNYTADDKPLFWLGGFVRVYKSCCTLGRSYCIYSGAPALKGASREAPFLQNR